MPLALVVEALAAGVRHLAGGLFEQQALGRQGEIDAAAVDLARQAVVVAVGVEAEQRQAEAVLAAGRPVAAADVAAGAHEDRHHVELEADRPIGLGVLDRDRARDRPAAELDDEVGHAVGQRRELVLVELADGGVGQPDGGLGRHVAGDAVGVGRLDDERRLRPAGEQVHLGRVDRRAWSRPGRGRTTPVATAPEDRSSMQGHVHGHFRLKNLTDVR